MKKAVLILILCLAVCLSGCAGKSPTPSEDTSASPSASMDNDSPKPAESSTGKISTVSIDTAQEWNDFARGYNSGRGVYSEVLTVEIGGRLDFDGIDYVPLYEPFSGTIRGKQPVEGYTEETMQYAKLYVSSYSEGYGFFNIGSIAETTGDMVAIEHWQLGFSLQQMAQESGALKLEDYVNDNLNKSGDIDTLTEAKAMFGIRCKTLTLENLVFEGIRADGLDNLLAYSIDDLTMKNILVTDCAIRDTYGFLACNTGRLSVDNLLITRCNTEILWHGGGLFMWVYENATFNRVGAAHLDVLLVPDGGGSGYTAGNTGLMSTFIGGKASFEQVELYNCSLYSLNSVALCQSYGSLNSCADITVQSSSFLGFPLTETSMTGVPGNKLLFGRNTMPAGERNVLLRDSMFNALGDLSGYAGYTVENCVSVTAE